MEIGAGMTLCPAKDELLSNSGEVSFAAAEGGFMISRILVATDGSEVAWKALEFGVDLAKQTGSTLILVSVIDRSLFLPASIPDMATPIHLIEPVEDYLKQAAEAYIEEAERLCEKQGIRSEKVLRSGHPAEEIITAAEQSKVGLIVMGSHGKSALKAALLGSVTFGVIHKDTKIPVLVVRR
jgi:nucleotide-binding universal stress UspA family protein